MNMAFVIGHITGLLLGTVILLTPKISRFIPKKDYQQLKQELNNEKDL